MKMLITCALVIAGVATASAQYLGSTGGLYGTGSNPNERRIAARWRRKRHGQGKGGADRAH